MIPNWLLWARELQAAAQTGLSYAANPYEAARYEGLRALASRMIAEGADESQALVEGVFAAQSGYATPKVDVRACIFRKSAAGQGEVLLVSEIIDGGRWTFPGGFADVNDTPSEAVIREVREEAGLVVKTTKLCAVYDRDKHGGTIPHPFHIYKLFFLCEILGTCERSLLETGEPQWFPVEAVPELSAERTQPWHIARMYEHFLHPELPAQFD